MFQLDSGARVWLIRGKTINSLSGIVANQMSLDPMSGYYFVFRGRKRNNIKILFGDKNGYYLWYKRLEEDQFRRPSNADEAK